MVDVEDYSKLGWPTFPCRYRSKFPYAALAPNGYLSATTEPAWRKRAPNCNVALACCPASGLLAIDVDPRHGGDTEWHKLLNGRSLPDTPVQVTGRRDGGFHLLFRRPDGDCRSFLAPGVDVRAAGYILVEPSVHPDTGQQYYWELSQHPLDTPVAALPEWLLRLVTKPTRPNSELIGPAATCYVALAFQAAGYTLYNVTDGKVSVECPLVHRHSSRTRNGTVIFAPTPQAPMGRLHCSHTGHGRIDTAMALRLLAGGQE